MTLEELQAVRDRSVHPAIRWNVLFAQADRDKLLAEVDRLRARLAELEAELNRGEACPS